MSDSTKRLKKKLTPGIKWYGRWGYTSLELKDEKGDVVAIIHKTPSGKVAKIEY